MSRRHKKRGEKSVAFRVVEGLGVLCVALVTLGEGAQNLERINQMKEAVGTLSAEAWNGTVKFVQKEAPAVVNWLDGVNKDTCFEVKLRKDGTEGEAGVSWGCERVGSRK